MGNRLHFLCGKMASGKSTLSKKLKEENDAILLCEDEILKKLYPTEIQTIQDYVTYSSRVKESLKEPIIDMLKKGSNVVLDFPANTKKQRDWFKEIYQEACVEHTLHYVDKSDDICKAQLKIRNKDLPKGSAFTTDEEFDAITKYFEEPCNDEDFEVIRYGK
jgi:predicted kinase